MTVLLPKRGLADRVLKWFGKEREMVLPDMNKIHDTFGPHPVVMGKRKGFWKALFSRKGKNPALRM